VPTFEETRAGYRNLWAKATVLADKRATAQRIALKIIANRARYQAIEAKAGAPWFLIGCLHQRESSMSFTRHLHNGDVLTARTVHVPAGRPKGGSPPFTFEESAIDALTMPPHELHKIKEWPVEQILYQSEKYNGFGYTSHGINSPYVWAWTSLQQRGKFVSDGSYDPGHWDEQPGIAALLKILAELDVDVAARLGGAPPPPPEPDQFAELARLLSTATDALAKATRMLEAIKAK
jgi:lysozyme family protein